MTLRLAVLAAALAAGCGDNLPAAPDAGFAEGNSNR